MVTRSPQIHVLTIGLHSLLTCGECAQAKASRWLIEKICGAVKDSQRVVGTLRSPRKKRPALDDKSGAGLAGAGI